jgi:hypothetical protein
MNFIFCQLIWGGGWGETNVYSCPCSAVDRKLCFRSMTEVFSQCNQVMADFPQIEKKREFSWEECSLFHVFFTISYTKPVCLTCFQLICGSCIIIGKTDIYIYISACSMYFLVVH